MTERITIREVVEYTIEVAESEKDNPEEWPDYFNAEGEIKSVHREVLDREHLVDYVLDVDIHREVWILRADGVNVFESRSHDLRDDEYLRRLGVDRNSFEVRSWFGKEYGDREDQDKTWKIINAGKGNNG